MDLSANSASIAAIVLCLLTAYYAWQTRETVRLLREQSESEFGKALRALLGEIRTIRLLVEEGRGLGTIAVEYPDSAWRQAQRHIDRTPVSTLDQLYDLYLKVYRLNAINREILINFSARVDRSALLQRRAKIMEELPEQMEALEQEVKALTTVSGNITKRRP